TLLFLRHLKRKLARLSRAPLLLLGGYRESEVEPGGPAGDGLAELVQGPSGDRMALRGLSEDEVARFIELTTGSPAPGPLVDLISRETAGNALFVTELVRLLGLEGRLQYAERAGTGYLRFTVPRGVRDVIERRLQRLSPD